MEPLATQVLQCWIGGKPTGKGRPKITARGGFARAYTPKKTRVEELRLRIDMERAMRVNHVERQSGPLRLILHCFFARPKSESKKHPRQWHTQRPDIDNVLKLVCDSFTGTLWDDDKQIISAVVDKQWVNTWQEEGYHVIVAKP